MIKKQYPSQVKISENVETKQSEIETKEVRDIMGKVTSSAEVNISENMEEKQN